MTLRDYRIVTFQTDRYNKQTLITCA